ANGSLMGGYALQVVLGGGHLDSVERVRMLQLGTAAAAVWAVAWLASRRWVHAWRETASPTARPLMLAQLGMAIAGNVWLLGVALTWLGLAVPARLDETGARDWIAAAGSPLGWLALGLTTAAVVVWMRQQRFTLGPHFAGVLGLSAAGLLACS